MRIVRYLPSPSLQPYIRCFMTIDSTAAVQNRVLPTPSLVLAVQYRGRVQQVQSGVLQPLPPAALTGMSRAPRWLAYAPNTATLLAHFTETGAAAFFAHPLHELFGTSLPLDHLLPSPAVAALTERVATASSTGQRLAVLEDFLLGRLRSVSATGPVRQALHLIQAAGGTASIRGVVAGMPVSRDPFEKHFRRLVGTSPKQFATIVRLRWVLAHRAGPRRWLFRPSPLQQGVQGLYRAGPHRVFRGWGLLVKSVTFYKRGGGTSRSFASKKRWLNYFSPSRWPCPSCPPRSRCAGLRPRRAPP